MFIYDLEKSRSNRMKHGIDFAEAQRLWDDPNRFSRGADSSTEVRSALVGSIDGVIWTAIYTRRSNLIRLISVRRAREYEKENYYRRGV